MDVYGHVPYDSGKKQHRLTIRKNLKTNSFEAYKHYFESSQGRFRPAYDEVVSNGTLAQVIDFTNAEVFRQWEQENQDQACDHSKVVSRQCQATKEKNSAFRELECARSKAK